MDQPCLRTGRHWQSSASSASSAPAAGATDVKRHFESSAFFVVHTAKRHASLHSVSLLNAQFRPLSLTAETCLGPGAECGPTVQMYNTVYLSCV